MIDALVAGQLHGAPAERATRNGTTFATCTVRAPTKGDAVLFVSCIAFRASARDALLALEAGDSCALAGELALKTWTDRDGKPKHGLDLTVHAVVTAYSVQRKRKAVERKAEPADPSTPAAAVPAAAPRLDFDDEIPF